jgi:ferredoxin
MMKLWVDPDRCQGHGRCYSVAPELFLADDLGNGREIGDGEVPPGLERKARLAAGNCPEQAISIDDHVGATEEKG